MIQKAKRPSRASEPAATPALDEAVLSRVRHALLTWYQAHRRKLPWRAHNDPYAIWVSEVMLQQTQVATVEPYYRRWLAAFPNVRALAAASESQVLQLWQGLGYYSRARSLHRGARHVVAEGGELPRSAEALRRLPGIGPYTAGAIASIAFGLDEPLVDGNVIRVLTRLFALPGDPRKAAVQKQLWAIARQLLPTGHAGDFNQALMELGALRCTPRRPLCGQCPVAAQCRARALDEVERFPELSKRPAITPVSHTAAIAERAGRLLVAQLRADAPRWGGLWLFPTVEQSADESPAQAAQRALSQFASLRSSTANPLHTITHSVTRYKITLTLCACQDVKGTTRRTDACAELRWLELDALTELAMPAPQRKLAEWLAQHGVGEF